MFCCLPAEKNYYYVEKLLIVHVLAHKYTVLLHIFQDLQFPTYVYFKITIYCSVQEIELHVSFLRLSKIS